MYVIKIIFLTLFLVACSSSESSKKGGRWVTAEVKPMTKTLYFNGIVKPLSVVYVTSPVEGVITKKDFHYGQSLKEGATVITIVSTKLETDYQTALVQYLKAKDKYVNDKAKFINTEELMKNELISRDSYNSEKQALASTQFDYLQAELKLEALMKQDANFKVDLSLQDIKEAEKALRRQFNSQVIVAPKSGIALFPIKSENSSSNESSGPIEVGSQVKQGQALLMVGDLTGMAMDIQVGEQDIQQVKVGQTVTVTGPAFPDITLQGVVQSVGAQAKATSGGMGAPPTFAVEIAVAKLTDSQRQHIQVGMSGKVALTLQVSPALQLPVNAVFEKDGEPWVKIQDPKTKKIKEVRIKTGKTTLTDVVIESGVTPGMKVWIHD